MTQMEPPTHAATFTPSTKVGALGRLCLWVTEHRTHTAMAWILAGSCPTSPSPTDLTHSCLTHSFERTDHVDH